MKPLDQLGTTVSEFIKFLGLFLEHGENRFRGITSVDLGGERVITEIVPRLVCILGQGNAEDGLKVGGKVDYIKSLRHGAVGEKLRV